MMGAAVAVKFPRIIRFFETVESDTCPHCGADGKYVHRVELEDGRRIGAMSGCIKLYPVSEIAREHLRISEKGRKCTARVWKLNGWDTRALDAIEAFYAGAMTEAQALNVVRCERAAAASWRKAKWGGR